MKMPKLYSLLLAEEKISKDKDTLINANKPVKVWLQVQKEQ